MNTNDFTPDHRPADADVAEAREPSLSRKIRLVSRLMRAEMIKTLHVEPFATRGEVKAAARAIERQAAEAVSAEDLATTVATLEKIADAFGGRDALPFSPKRHRGRGGHRGQEHGGHRQGRGGHRGHELSGRGGHRGHRQHGHECGHEHGKR